MPPDPNPPSASPSEPTEPSAGDAPDVCSVDGLCAAALAPIERIDAALEALGEAVGDLEALVAEHCAHGGDNCKTHPAAALALAVIELRQRRRHGRPVGTPQTAQLADLLLQATPATPRLLTLLGTSARNADHWMRSYGLTEAEVFDAAAFGRGRAAKWVRA